MIHFNDDHVEEIWYVVLNTPITITPSVIIDIIKCEEDGVDIECYETNLTFHKDILFIAKSIGNPSKVSNLTHATSLWYQLIITNFLPRDQNSPFLSMDDKHLIYFIISRVKVNLHLTIFNCMKEKIMTSREVEFSFIPFGRVLSEMFVQKGIVKEIHIAGLNEVLDTS